MKELTESQIEEARRNIREAKDPKAQVGIEADLLGIEKRALEQALNGEPVVFKAKRHQINAEERDRIATLSANGMTKKAIAEMLGLHPSTVSRALKIVEEAKKPRHEEQAGGCAAMVVSAVEAVELPSVPMPEAEPATAGAEPVLVANCDEQNNVQERITRLVDAADSIFSTLLLCREIQILSEEQEEVLDDISIMLMVYAQAFEAGVNFAGGEQ